MSLLADILDATNRVTKTWEKQRKAEERARKSRASRADTYSDRVNFTDVAEDILPAAYEHVSGGRYSVAKRQLFYACRERFKEEAGRELEYSYFANTLLVQYMNRHPETASWKVTADPRGTLSIPNAGYEVHIPCGTLAIEDHLDEVRSPVSELDIDARVRVEFQSLAGGRRYQGLLYIEKEGLDPVLREARIAERFDLAILSCKGQSVVAARRFVDEVCAVGSGVRLFVVHDMDKAGFEISQRLTSVSAWAEDYDRVTYEFQNEIDVIDLGLRLVDVHKFGLKGESCPFKGYFASDSIATAEEQRYIRSGRRVELNEFTSPQFLEWLEGKLREHLPQRLIPDDATLQAAYRRALAVAKINAAVKEARDAAIEKARASAVNVEALRRRLRKEQKKSDQAWDAALYAIAEQDSEDSL